MLQNLVDLKIKPVISTFDDYEFYLNNDVYNIKYILQIQMRLKFYIINKPTDVKTYTNQIRKKYGKNTKQI